MRVAVESRRRESQRSPSGGVLSQAVAVREGDDGVLAKESRRRQWRSGGGGGRRHDLESDCHGVGLDKQNTKSTRRSLESDRHDIEPATHQCSSSTACPMSRRPRRGCAQVCAGSLPVVICGATWTSHGVQRALKGGEKGRRHCFVSSEEGGRVAPHRRAHKTDTTAEPGPPQTLVGEGARKRKLKASLE